MSQKTWRILPHSTAGKWSLGLIVAMPLLFTLGMSMADSIYRTVPAGGTILADIAARPALALTMLAGMASGAAAFITGLLAILKKQDHAALVYISTFIGALLILFLSAEFMAPH